MKVEIENRLLIPQIGYVYFIINEEDGKIYVGETTNINRIENYEKIYKNKKVFNKKNINSSLLNDLISDICFSFYHFETIHYKKYEKIYLKFFSCNNYPLYNKQFYKLTSYNDDLIDRKLLETMGVRPSNIIKMWKEHNLEGHIGDVYLGEGLYGTKDGDIIEY